MTSSWILDLVLLVIAGGVVVIVLNLFVVWVRREPTGSKPRSKASIARIRRLMLGIGAALLVGGWGATQYGKQLQSVSTRGRSWSRHPSGQFIYIGGFTGMAVGAGLIGFAVLRPTNRNDE